MKRVLWLGIGLAVGALAVRTVAKKAHALRPEGVAGSVRRSASGLADSVRGFADDVRAGMAEREAQIHDAFIEGQLIGDESEPGPGKVAGSEKEEGYGDR